MPGSNTIYSVTLNFHKNSEKNIALFWGGGKLWDKTHECNYVFSKYVCMWNITAFKLKILRTFAQLWQEGNEGSMPEVTVNTDVIESWISSIVSVIFFSILYIVWIWTWHISLFECSLSLDLEALRFYFPQNIKLRSQNKRKYTD